MAIIEVKVPQLSESVAEATLLQWHKKVGEAVARDENLIDVETDNPVAHFAIPQHKRQSDITQTNNTDDRFPRLEPVNQFRLHLLTRIVCGKKGDFQTRDREAGKPDRETTRQGQSTTPLCPRT